MMGKNAVITMASKLFPNMDKNKLGEAFDKASEIMKMANNPQEALQKAGVTSEKLSQAKSLLDNPLASNALKFMGVDKKNALDVLNNIEGQKQTNSVSANTSTDKLASLQKNLARLRK